MGVRGIVNRNQHWSLEKKDLSWSWLPQPLQDMVARFAIQRWFHKVEQDYRRTTAWGRRFTEDWIHQEGLLVAQVEGYEKEGETK